MISDSKPSNAPGPGSIVLPSLQDLKISIARERYSTDPHSWVAEKLKEFLWSKQLAMLTSVRDHRRTAVHSCHGPGKALALDTPLPTPAGWTTMGLVQPGDLLLGEDGQPVTVVAVSPIEEREAFQVTFDDDTSIVASDHHLWNAIDLKQRPRYIRDWRDHWDSTKTLTTAEMAASPKDRNQLRWRIPTARPVESNEPWTLPISPYTFGAWLGDGTTIRAELTCHIDDAAFFARAIDGGTVLPGRSNRASIVRFGDATKPYVNCPGKLTNGKRIPQSLLRSSVADRLELLRGIMDTDGTIPGSRAECGVSITLCSIDLMDDVEELVRSLGWKTFRDSRPAKLNGRTVGTAYRISFRPDVNPFTLPRKASIWARYNENVKQRSRHTQRTIVEIKPIGRTLVKCVVVDSPRHLYLAGKGFIPTHNSWCAARAVCWWLDTHPPGEAFVVTSAPTAAQVRAILWREIGRAHAKGKLSGRLNQTEWWMQPLEGNEEIVAYGRKPADMDPTSFSGIHARYVLVVLDEASGIPVQLWEAADTLLTNDNARILAIGNPESGTEFEEVCKPGSGWNVIHISYKDTPNFTGEVVPESIRDLLIGPTWVEERRKKWGETNPLYIAKVLGLFPEIRTDGLFQPKWISQAQRNTLEAPSTLIPYIPNELGVDVGGGRDKSVIAHRLGSRVRIIHRDTNENTMTLLGHVIQKLRDTGATIAKVDRIGIGKGVCDRAAEIVKTREPNWELCRKIVGVNVALPANNREEFINLRAESYWTVRERAETNTLDLDPLDDDLAAQLLDLKWFPTLGRVQIESKKDIRKRGRQSPDDADAVMLSFLKLVDPDSPDEDDLEEIDLVPEG